MAAHGPNGSDPCARRDQQLVMHAKKMLSHDIEIRLRHEVVDVGDAPGNRIVDRNHGKSLASPPNTAAKASSKTRQASGSYPGNASLQAM